MRDQGGEDLQAGVRWKAEVPQLVPVTTPDGRTLRVPRRLVAADKRGLL